MQVAYKLQAQPNNNFMEKDFDNLEEQPVKI